MNWKNMKGLARDWVFAIALVIGLWFIWLQFFAPAPMDAGPAPEFTLENLEGEAVSLSQHDDVVVLNFWFTSCPPCRHEIPELTAFHEANPDVPLYGVSIDKMAPERLAALSRKLGVGYPVLHDRNSQVAAQYGVNLFPTTVVIHKGEIARVRQGEVTRSSLESLVASVHDH